MNIFQKIKTRWSEYRQWISAVKVDNHYETQNTAPQKSPATGVSSISSDFTEAGPDEGPAGKVVCGDCRFVIPDMLFRCFHYYHDFVTINRPSRCKLFEPAPHTLMPDYDSMGVDEDMVNMINNMQRSFKVGTVRNTLSRRGNPAVTGIMKGSHSILYTCEKTSLKRRRNDR